MEEGEMELTTKQVAEALRVSPVTVSLWSRNRKLVGFMARNARKSGRRFRVDAVRTFARNAGDEGYSERLFEEWFKSNKEAVLAAQRPSASSTDVLASED